MSRHTIVSVRGATPVAGAGPWVQQYVAAVPVTWCAACREWTEFVVPVGLPDAEPDEFACLHCGWALLVPFGPPGSRDLPEPGTGDRAA